MKVSYKRTIKVKRKKERWSTLNKIKEGVGESLAKASDLIGKIIKQTDPSGPNAGPSTRNQKRVPLTPLKPSKEEKDAKRR